MSFYFPIAKAKRPPWRKTRTYNRLFRLSDAMAKVVGADLFTGLRKFKSNVDPERVYQAWKSGNYSKILEAIPWAKLPEHLEPAAKKVQSGMEKSARFNIEKLPKAVNEGLRFSMQNPRIRDYVGKRTGELVVNIQTDTQRVIQNAVARSFDHALTPDSVAGIIRGSIGLYPQQETALFNYHNGLTKQGLDGDRIAQLTAEYEDRLLNQRAMTIARTETRLATNVAQQSVWEQASNAGMLPSETSRVWIVDGAPCEICEPMDGVEVGLYEPWVLPNGDAVMVPSESHPNCMCGMELKMGYNDESLGSDQVAD